MKLAYVDTSCLVAIAFGEPGSGTLARRLEGFDELLSSNLLEAELRASFAREDVPIEEDLLTWVTWVIPDRALSPELKTVLSTGYLRGADAWHVACAMYLAVHPEEMSFITLDKRQEEVAEELGFPN